jgi:hypothetical protein
VWAQVRKRWGFDGGRTAALMQSGGQATIWEPHPWEVRTWPQPGRQALIEAHKSTSSLIREGSGGFAMIVSASGMGGAGSGFSVDPHYLPPSARVGPGSQGHRPVREPVRHLHKLRSIRYLHMFEDLGPTRKIVQNTCTRSICLAERGASLA